MAENKKLNKENEGLEDSTNPDTYGVLEEAAAKGSKKAPSSQKNKKTAKKKKQLVYTKMTKEERALQDSAKYDIQANKEKDRRKKPIPPEQIPDEMSNWTGRMADYTIPPLEERKEMRRIYNAVRPDFMRWLATNHLDDLKKLGLTKHQIGAMKAGKSPKGYSVHHIVPLHGGGSNDFSNFCLIQERPYHNYIHERVIHPQIRCMNDGEARKIKLFYPAGPVFIPPKTMDKRIAHFETEKAKKIADRKKKEAEKLANQKPTKSVAKRAARKNMKKMVAAAKDPAKLTLLAQKFAQR